MNYLLLTTTAVWGVYLATWAATRLRGVATRHAALKARRPVELSAIGVGVGGATVAAEWAPADATWSSRDVTVAPGSDGGGAWQGPHEHQTHGGDEGGDELWAEGGVEEELWASALHELDVPWWRGSAWPARPLARGCLARPVVRGCLAVALAALLVAADPGSFGPYVAARVAESRSGQHLSASVGWVLHLGWFAAQLARADAAAVCEPRVGAPCALGRGANATAPAAADGDGSVAESASYAQPPQGAWRAVVAGASLLALACGELDLWRGRCCVRPRTLCPPSLAALYALAVFFAGPFAGLYERQTVVGGLCGALAAATHLLC